MNQNPSLSALEVTDAQSAAVQKTPNRVTLQSIKDKVVDVEFFRPAMAPRMTIAVVKMENGFVMLGQSAPADPANFDEELGKQFAFENAIGKVWTHEGYLLCEKLYQESLVKLETADPSQTPTA